MIVAITGVTGTIGRLLAEYLAARGHTVVPVLRSRISDEARRPESWGAEPIYWNPDLATIDLEQLAKVDAVVHLAGEPIASDKLFPPSRWTKNKRQRILDSRVQGTELMAKALAETGDESKVLICASAIGYYGDRGNDMLDEDAKPGSGFLSEVVQKWEEATQPAVDAGMRVVNMRIGVVVTPQGGALRQLLGVAKLGAGGPLGTGRQWWSWVGINDVVGAFEHALSSQELAGPVNVVAPSPVTMNEFARTLGRVIRRPAVLRAPAFALRAVLGRELANELLLASTRVSPARLQQSGYEFLNNDLEELLREQLGAYGAVRYEYQS